MPYLQFYNVIADPKVNEQHISTKYSKCNRFQVTTDLLNSEKLKVAITQLCHDIQVCNFTVITDPKVGGQHIYRKYFTCNSYN